MFLDNITDLNPIILPMALVQCPKILIHCMISPLGEMLVEVPVLSNAHVYF